MKIKSKLLLVSSILVFAQIPFAFAAGVYSSSPGGTVTINGTNFTPMYNAVQFKNNTTGEISEVLDISATDPTKLTFMVPTTTPPGKYTIKVGAFNSGWSNELPFNVINTTTVTKNPVTISGTVTMTDTSTGQTVSIASGSLTVTATGPGGAPASVNQTGNTFSLYGAKVGTYNFTASANGYSGKGSVTVTDYDQTYTHTIPVAISINVTPPTAAPTIKVTYPNKATDILSTESTYGITWESKNFPSTGKVRLTLGYDIKDTSYVGGTHVDTIIADNVANTGNYYWTIPQYYGSGIVASSFTMKITALDAVYSTSDSSDEKFTVKLTKGWNQINVTSPTLGQTYALGGALPISWSPSGLGSATISLFKKGDPSFLRLSLPITGTSPNVKWSPISYIPEGTYFVRVTEGANKEKSGYSDSFTVKNSVVAPVSTTTQPVVQPIQQPPVQQVPIQGSPVSLPRTSFNDQSGKSQTANIFQAIANFFVNLFSK